MSVATADGPSERLCIVLEIDGYADLAKPDAGRLSADLERVWEAAQTVTFPSADSLHLAWRRSGGGLTGLVAWDLIAPESIGRLIEELLKGLNRRSGEPRLRVRMAMDLGPIAEGSRGFDSEAAATARLLADDPEVHLLLSSRPDAQLAVIVSSRCFEKLIQPGYWPDPAQFRRVDTDVNGSDLEAWLTLATPRRPPTAVPVSRDAIERARATFVQPVRYPDLIRRLAERRFQVLAGPPGTGRYTTAVVALSEMADILMELDPGTDIKSLEIVDPRTGYLLVLPDSGPSRRLQWTEFHLVRLASLCQERDAYLIVIEDSGPWTVPNDYVIVHEPPPREQVMRHHFAFLQPGGTHDLPELLSRLGPIPESGTMTDLVSRIVAAIERPAEPSVAAQADPEPDAVVGPPEALIARDFWTYDDRLGYDRYADAIAAFIRHPNTQPPLTIGIRAPWGAGKTSLMRMVQQRLDPHRSGEATQIRLTDGSRTKLMGTKSTVSMRELFRRLRRPSAADQVAAKDLDVDAPKSGILPDPKQDWRPTVWFNPWMYQSGEQVWAGLAHEIVTQVTSRMPTSDRERFWLLLNLRRADRQALRRKVYTALLQRLLPVVFAVVAAIVIGGGLLTLGWLVPAWGAALRWVVAGLVGIGMPAVLLDSGRRFVQFFRQRAADEFGPLVREPAAGLAPDAKGLADVLLPDPGYESRLGFLHLVQTDMKRVLDLIATPTRPLVVFVDDLDRCSPGTVVQAIEAINLFLAGEFPNCVFVLALEPDMLAAHIDAAYASTAGPLGQTPVGWRFLDKFVQLPVSLPAAAPQVERYVSSLINEAAGSGSPVGVPDRETGFSERVQRIETAIMERGPSLADLPRVTAAAQRDALGLDEPMVRPEAVAAATRVMARLYNDRQAAVIMQTAVGRLGSTNPREIKRLLNLFRFYSFIVEQDRIRGGPGCDPDRIAKLCILSIRWPHLLRVLQSETDGDPAATVLRQLEQVARSSGDGADLWTQAAARTGLSAQDGPGRHSVEDLRRFLAGGDEISTVAAMLL